MPNKETAAVILVMLATCAAILVGGLIGNTYGG